MEKNNWPARLLAWFDENRRELPWRESHPRNPYHVWISEIMLQQTRTETVREYFRRWMEQFPTIKDLAQASEEQVLRAWQGLGYYSRARNLHKAARQIMVEWAGRMPAEKKALAALPGIGPYTVGAILSMAFGQPTPAVDGNLLRVLSRLYGVEEDISSTAGKKVITARAEQVLPEERPGDFNEAMMDLGAEICIPKHPRCSLCPVQEDCMAWRENRTESLPVKKPKPVQKEFAAACGIFCREGRYLLHKRSSRGMLAAMWEFPMALDQDEGKAREDLETLLGTAAGPMVWQHKHVFTHQIWHMEAYILEKAICPKGEWAYFSPAEWEKVPLAGPHVKLAAWLKKNG